MSAIKERPILFNGPMVRAILEGRKTVTRRALKPQPEVREVDMIGPMLTFKNKRGGHWLYPNAKAQIIADCPYGKPGDRLWLREAFGEVYEYCDHPEMPGCPTEYWHIAWKYRADGEAPQIEDGVFTGWKPSIHMPRVACRILLEITDVRVERLHGISDEQAKAEGIEPSIHHPSLWRRGPLHGDQNIMQATAFPKLAFRSIWEAINGHESWAANPWVWVVEFRRVQP